jgi:predicted RNA-binding protein with PUA-like domain
MSARTRHWLMKSEPDAFSIDDLQRAGIEPWNGVRNYQARNFMRDGMQVGDGILFYHSNTKVPGIVGLARVASAAYPDETQFDPGSDYFDPKATRENPRWMLVDVAFERKLRR